MADSVPDPSLKYVSSKTGTLVLSNPTKDVTITIAGLRAYIINESLAYTNSDESNPSFILQGKSATLKYTAITGYNLPSSVTVANATMDSWSSSTGELKISNPTSDVTITITSVAQSYTVTTNLLYCSKVSGPTGVNYGESATFVFEASTGYNLPSSITLSGATLDSWTQSTGTLKIKNVTGNVTIGVTATIQTYNITTNLTGCTKTSGPTTLNYGATGTFVFAASTGYNLPASVTVTGATIDSWTQSTGTLKVKGVIGAVSITVTATLQVYNITLNLTHCTKKSGPTTIEYGKGGTIVIAADTGYELPENINFTGATLTGWDESTGELTFSKATGNITAEIEATLITYSITTNLTNVVGDASNPTSIGYGETVTLTFTPSGDYELPDTITVDGATYTWEVKES